MNPSQRTNFIKRTAKSLGFDFVGISQAKFLKEDAKRLEKWLQNGHQAGMGYMENYFDKRCDPRKLVPGSKSVISLLYNYHSKIQQKEGSFKIAKYAYGKDYHFVIKDKLESFWMLIEEEIGKVEGRYFVDSAPVLDRAWARESGLGWIGKNSMLINKQQGSDFFIAELILDLELEYDAPLKDYCGTCNKCVESCPTDAITEDRAIDSNKCISYLTIELKDAVIDDSFKAEMNDWIFGCDICQDICPWNRFAIANEENQFVPSLDLLQMSKEAWKELDREKFNQLFKKSAVKRTKFTGLKRNINFLTT